MKNELLGVAVVPPRGTVDERMGRTRTLTEPPTLQAMQAGEEEVSLNDLLKQYDSIVLSKNAVRMSLQIIDRVNTLRERVASMAPSLCLCDVRDLALFSSWFALKGGW